MTWHNIIVFDLEATCFRLKKPPPPEIIEIGAVKLDAEGNEISKFQSFVKPVIAPRLSKFCTKLTGIRQEHVNHADEFDSVIFDFEDWIMQDAQKVPILASWGRYDIQQLHMETQRIDHQLLHSYEHIPLNEEHARINQLQQPIGLSNALKLDNLEFEGTPHGALDDAINASRIFRRFVGQWKIPKPIRHRRR